MQAYKGAILAACAEDMFQDDKLAPALDARAANDWKIVGYLTATNALFDLHHVGLGEREYYGFLAQSLTDELEYIAVVRGTAQIVEWMEDVQFLMTNSHMGRVESGFFSIYETMQCGGDSVPAAASIATYLPNGARVTVIGHSLGAVLATFLTYDLRQTLAPDITVIGQFFASPKPGSEKFANRFDEVVGAANYKVYNYDFDIVPHFPPHLHLIDIGFHALPHVEWLERRKVPVNIKNTLDCNHDALSYAAMLGAPLEDCKNGCIV